MRITVLVEDTPAEDPNLRHEHGLSYWIEAESGPLLFDTGSSGRAVENARHLGLPVSTLRNVVVSHGHYDHGDGLPSFLDASRERMGIHLAAGYFVPKYSRSDSGPLFKGLKYDRDLLEKRAAVHEYAEPVTRLEEDIYLVRSFPRRTKVEKDNPRFILPRGDDGYVVDTFSDEQLVVLRCEKGLIVVVGCSHPGIMNMVSTVEERFEEPIHGVIGGFHLVDADPDRIDATVSFFRERAFPMIAPCHCTGAPAIERLQEIPGSLPVRTGTVITL